MSLSREELLKGRPLGVAKVELPGGRGEVYVRELRGKDVVGLETARWPISPQGYRVHDAPNDDLNWVVLCACDADGKPLFDGEFNLDREQAATLPGTELAAIAAAARALNRVGRAAIEAAAKN